MEESKKKGLVYGLIGIAVGWAADTVIETRNLYRDHILDLERIVDHLKEMEKQGFSKSGESWRSTLIEYNLQKKMIEDDDFICWKLLAGKKFVNLKNELDVWVKEHR